MSRNEGLTALLHYLKRKDGFGDEQFDRVDSSRPVFHMFGFMDRFAKLPGGYDAPVSYGHDQ
jgi:hypothetical protein